MEKLIALMTAAFGLVAALAWNDTIKLIFKSIFGEQSNITAMLLYAIIVTAIAVFVTMQIAKATPKDKEE